MHSYCPEHPRMTSHVLITRSRQILMTSKIKAAPGRLRSRLQDQDLNPSLSNSWAQYYIILSQLMCCLLWPKATAKASPGDGA